jgi:hypothetical protein
MVYSSVAQLVEQRTVNPWVVRSSRTGGAILVRWRSGSAAPLHGEGHSFKSDTDYHIGDIAQLGER